MAQKGPEMAKNPVLEMGFLSPSLEPLVGSRRGSPRPSGSRSRIPQAASPRCARLASPWSSCTRRAKVRSEVPAWAP